MKFSKQFLIDAGERALATFVQTVLALLGTDALNLFSLDWKATLATAGSAALLSLLKSFAGGKVSGTGTASWSKATLPAPLPVKVDAVADRLAAARAVVAAARRE